MNSMYLLLEILQTLGIALAVGSSTFAIIFYYKAIRDGVIDESEYSFMHTVYAVLRIGMGVIILSQLLFVVWYYSIGELNTLLNGAFWFQWTLIALILVNAALMFSHLIPMWLGPAIAGASWYSFLVINTLATLPIPYWIWAIYFLAFFAVFLVFLQVVQKVYVDGFQQYQTLSNMKKRDEERVADRTPLHQRITKGTNQ